MLLLKLNMKLQFSHITTVNIYEAVHTDAPICNENKSLNLMEVKRNMTLSWRLSFDTSVKLGGSVMVWG